MADAGEDERGRWRRCHDSAGASFSTISHSSFQFPSRTSTTYSVSTKLDVRGGESPRGTGPLPTTSIPELPFCRICHDTGEDSCGPLIAPCQCDGSLKHVHQYCLQRWIDMRHLKRCELCHSKFKNPMLAIPNGRVSLCNVWKSLAIVVTVSARS